MTLFIIQTNSTYLSSSAKVHKIVNYLRLSFYFNTKRVFPSAIYPKDIELTATKGVAVADASVNGGHHHIEALCKPSAYATPKHSKSQQ